MPKIKLSKTAKRILGEVQREFRQRKFAAGLLAALADMFVGLEVPSLGATNFADVTARYPRVEVLSGGRKANTLILERGGKSVSLRPFYDAIEKHLRAEKKRFGYPSCAPHATQAWGDYREWLDALSQLSAVELAALRASVIQFVLSELPSHAFVPGSVTSDPPLLEAVIQDFDFTARVGEPTGASFQALAFGFLRADNPHLQMEVAKVRAGSKRLQRVGDIDGWDGRRLALTAEVKQFVVKATHLPGLKAFANEVATRGAIGLLVAYGVDDVARASLEEDGVHVLDRDDLLRIVGIWDPAKQAIAISSMIYVFEHVEKNRSLSDRLAAFLEELKGD